MNGTPVVIDNARGVKWYQHINASGTHMTTVVCLSTGWSIDSNQYQVGNLPDAALDDLVKQLRNVIRTMQRTKGPR
jgi:hypothetical protein